MNLQEHFLRGFQKRAAEDMWGDTAEIPTPDAINRQAMQQHQNFIRQQEQALDPANVQRKFQAGGDYSMDMGAGERFAKQQMADLHPASAARMAMHAVADKINDHSGLDLASGSYAGQSNANNFGASHITDNGRPVSGIGASGNIEYGQPRSNPVPPPAQNTASNPGFSFGIGSMHSSLGNQSPRPATPNISEPIVQTNWVNANHSSPAPQTQGLGSQSLSGSKPLSHFSSSPSSVNPISPQPVQRQQPMQSSAIQPPHLSSSAPLHTSHLQTAQLQPAHSLGAPAGLGHLHR